MTAADSAPPRIHSLVPGGRPVELVASYPEFAGYYPTCEMQTKRWLARHVRPDWTAIDVGANVGIHAVLVARLAAEGHVHAFEPTATAEMLRENLAHAGLANVTVHQVAVGDRTGLREEPIHRIWGAEPEMRPYPFTTVDAFVRERGLERLDLLKIDTDGYDLEALRGARETLERFDPWVIVELNHALATRGHSPNEALAWLAGQGYREALVLDGENFLLRRRESAACPGADLCLRFDRDPVVVSPALVPGEELPGLVGDEPALHNGSEAVDGSGRAFAIPGPRWAFGAAWPLAGNACAGPAVLEVEARVRQGAVGIGCVTADLAALVGEESFLDPGPDFRPVRVLLPDPREAAWAMVRNASEDGGTAVVEVGAIRVFRAEPVDRPEPAVLREDVASFDLDDLPTGDDGPRGASPARTIPIVPVGRLGEALGFSRPYVPARLLHREGLAGFRSETDEADLYRYLYREHAPERHLEFGTWEGFGALLCAESCAAEIWTVDLPGGETDAAGKPVYGVQSVEGDAGDGPAPAGGSRIGWRYREAGFGGRVHQILRDSRELTAEEFAGLPFDSALVDGGHAPEVVASDTELALALVRAGGLVIWHDFCPDPEALAGSEAGRGVVRAWQDRHDRWRPRLSTLFWIRPSWLLVGVVA